MIQRETLHTAIIRHNARLALTLKQATGCVIEESIPHAIIRILYRYAEVTLGTLHIPCLALPLHTLTLANRLFRVGKIRTRRNRRHACETLRLFIEHTFLTTGARIAAGICSGILLPRTLDPLPDLPALHNDNPFVPNPNDCHAALQLLAGLEIYTENGHFLTHTIREGAVQTSSKILHLPGHR